MAKYTITYACGCTEEIQLFGKREERERTISNLESHDCPRCRAAAAQKAAEAAGLPALTGSEKQIAWASEIRKSALSNIDKLRAIAIDKEKAESLFANLLAHTSASFWIDNRAAATSTNLRTFGAFVFTAK